MISPSDLVDNAALFGREAAELILVHGLSEKDWRFVAVFAATSLEQLAKAALAERNLLLLAETRENSVLALGGAPRHADNLRTIGASKAIDRYSEFNRQFAPLSTELKKLLDVRNGVVHLAAQAPEEFDNLFNSFLRAVELLADELDLDEEGFWGPELLPLVESRRSDRVKTIEANVENLIARALAVFESKYRDLTENERAGAIAGAEQQAPASWFTDASFQQTCPACGRLGWIGVAVDGEWEFSDGEMLARAWFQPNHFACAVCSLQLVGDEAEWAFPDVELPDGFDFEDLLDEPQDIEDIPGYGGTDVHPYPPPH